MGAEPRAARGPRGSDDSSLGLHGCRARSDLTARKHGSAQTHGPDTRPTEGNQSGGVPTDAGSWGSE